MVFLHLIDMRKPLSVAGAECFRKEINRMDTETSFIITEKWR